MNKTMTKQHKELIEQVLAVFPWNKKLWLFPVTTDEGRMFASIHKDDMRKIIRFVKK